MGHDQRDGGVTLSDKVHGSDCLIHTSAGLTGSVH